MLTFAMTTTTKLAGLSLYENDKLLGEIHVEMAKTHSTTILEQIDSLLKWTGKKLDEIENVIVSIGPGSFTGVRIAISVVKGLFFGRNVSIGPGSFTGVRIAISVVKGLFFWKKCEFL